MAVNPKKLINKKKVDLANIVDSETGEYLLDKLGKTTSITVSEKTGLVKLESTDFAVIETEAVLALSKILNNPDLANVLKMSITAKTSFNILFNNNVPHNNTSLQSYLELNSKAMYLALIKRLINAGVLYKIEGKMFGSVRTCYILNPMIARKRKVVEEKVIEIFENFKF